MTRRRRHNKQLTIVDGAITTDTAPSWRVTSQWIDSLNNTATHSTHVEDEGGRTTVWHNKACNKRMQDSYS